MTVGADVDHDEDEDEEREYRRARRRKKKRIIEEPTPVISGRFFIALLIVVMFLIPKTRIGAILEPKEPADTTAANWKVGGKETVAITLITADYNKLACASETVVDGYHCMFKSETETFPREPGAPLDDNKAKIIQPYRTPETNKLIMVAGLWAQPDVALRLHREPSSGVEEEKLARFTVNCEVKFIGVLPKEAKLRWNPGQWVSPDMTALVARPESCKVAEPDPP